MLIYTGIGSRNTPDDVLKTMTALATELELTNYTLRSGGAEGADTAFEVGVHSCFNQEIYLPWKGFNNSHSPLHSPSDKAIIMAKAYHPNWDACSRWARLFHARNCHQVLGQDLKTPTDFVLCWTPKGQWIGGTSQALRIADHWNIPIFNLADDNWDTEFNTFIEEDNHET